MAEQLKRWNGTAWVAVAAVNRFVIGSDMDGALLYQPNGYANSIPPGYPFTGANESLYPMSGLAISYTYTVE